MTRSDTESKNAPRGPAVPDALATAPSSRSGRAQSTRSRSPPRRAPLAMATDAAAASTTPVAVRWSAVMPVRRMLAPTGLRPSSKLCRQRPSNMADRLPGDPLRSPHRAGRPAGGPATGGTAGGGRPRETGRARRWGAGTRARRPPRAGRSPSSAPWKVRTGAVTDERSMPGLELARHVVDQPLAAAGARSPPAPGRGPRRPPAPGRARGDRRHRPTPGRALERHVGGQRIGDEVRAPPRRPARPAAPPGPARRTLGARSRATRRARRPRRPPPAGSCATSPIPATRSPSAVAAASADKPAGRPAHEQHAGAGRGDRAARARSAPSAARPAPGARSLSPAPGRSTARSRTPASARDGVGRTGEAGVGRAVQVDDRRAGGIADVVVGEEAPVGQARACSDPRAKRKGSGYPAQHSQLSTARGSRVQPFSSEKIRNVALVGPRRRRQDDARRGAPAPSRGHQPPRTRRGRHARSATTTPRSSAGGSRSRSPSRRSSGRATRSTWSTRRATPTSSATCGPRCGSSTWPCSW